MGKGKLNPADAFRRSLKKKEKAKNKQARQKARKEKIQELDTGAIRHKITTIRSNAGPTLEGPTRKKIQELQDLLKQVEKNTPQSGNDQQNITAPSTANVNPPSSTYNTNPPSSAYNTNPQSESSTVVHNINAHMGIPPPPKGPPPNMLNTNSWPPPPPPYHPNPNMIGNTMPMPPHRPPPTMIQNSALPTPPNMMPVNSHMPQPPPGFPMPPPPPPGYLNSSTVPSTTETQNIGHQSRQGSHEQVSHALQSNDFQSSSQANPPPTTTGKKRIHVDKNLARLVPAAVHRAKKQKGTVVEKPKVTAAPKLSDDATIENKIEHENSDAVTKESSVSMNRDTETNSSSTLTTHSTNVLQPKFSLFGNSRSIKQNDTVNKSNTDTAPSTVSQGNKSSHSASAAYDAFMEELNELGAM